MDIGFKYKGSHYYIDVQPSMMNLQNTVFTLYDLGKIEQIKIDQSEKELAKIELKESKSSLDMLILLIIPARGLDVERTD
ncbi:hypothetical protein LCGC14_2910510, partial [marine sediment metagenome]